MNKRGFLLAEEVMKIIIAVIALGLLSYLLFSLYNLNRTSDELELAESSLEHLVQELNSGRDEIEIFNPKGWILSSWSSGGDIPLSCSGVGWESCICICDSELLKTESRECDSVGVCSESDFVIKRKLSDDTFELEIFERNIRISPPLVLKVNYGDKTISKN